jgi:acyl transferase domain-containing protein
VESRPVIVDSSITHSVVFLFPGQGKAYQSLGRDLYRQERCFREEMDDCATYLLPILKASISEMLFKSPNDQLYRPSVWQPALFALDYAMARLWMSWGIKPSAMIGHSLGEYVAATLAGVMELGDALRLVAERGRLTEHLEPGAMLALHATEDETLRYVRGRVSLAAVNGPKLCIVSGPTDEIANLETKLVRYEPVRLAASHAFHSPLVEPLLEPLTRLVSEFRRRPPRIPYLSTVSGTWISDEDAIDDGYWASHLRQTVRFYDCLQEVARTPGCILLEVGPGSVLTDLVRSSLHGVPAFSSFEGSRSDGSAISSTLGQLWSHGAEPDWATYYKDERRRRIPLPTYPFDRRSCWVQEKSQQHTSREFPVSVEKQCAETILCSVEPTARSLWKKVPVGPGHARPQLSTIYKAPLNETEKVIAELWQTALGFQRIGVDDNFFELGGHSLLVVQVVKRINETFSTQIAVRNFFDAPTVAQLARIVLGEPSLTDDPDVLEALLNEIEGLSDEQVEAELRGQGQSEKSA